MRLYTYWIYFIAGDETTNYQRVTAMNVRDALIKASARQLESGKDCRFYKAKKQDRFEYIVCFDYGKDDPRTLTY